MKTSSSIAALMELKDMTPELAKHIRHIWKDAKREEIIKILGDDLHHGYLESLRYGRMLAINKIARYPGVEYLGRNKHGQDVEYLNAGDSYTLTICFVGDRLFINYWAAFVESGYIKETTPEYY